MSYRNPNISQGSDEVHNLKDSISEADYSSELGEDKKDKRKETKFEKKFLFKKDSKDKGYSSLAGEANQDSVFLVGSKNKKIKADTKITSLSVFKKSFKDEKRSKDLKETKEESKRNKKLKDRSGLHGIREHKEHLFGTHLENAVRSYPSNDGVKVPGPIRICLDIIEQNGTDSEHIYRRSVNKSQLESICDSINSHKIETRLDELNADANLACSVVKKFLRELKSSFINEELLNILEKCDSTISDKDVGIKIEFLKKQIAKMPQSNLDTFSYIIMHFHRILSKSDSNKIEIGIFVQKFQPYFRIKERLFKYMIIHADSLFSEYRFKKYKIRSNDDVSRFSLLPDNIEDLEQEISKQEVYLSKLHSRIANEENSTDKALQEQLSEELWALQRYVTSLKRKVKKLKLESKNIEIEQMKKLKEVQSQRENVAPKTDVNTENSEHKEILDTDGLNLVDLSKKDIALICENSVLIESIQQLLDRTNQERLMTNDLQQKMSNLSRTAPAPEASQMTFQELLDNEQLILNENKLLEERIHLINKRINVEKEKIFELKLNIQLKTIPNLTSEQIMTMSTNQLEMHGKKGLPDSKELIMTKL